MNQLRCPNCNNNQSDSLQKTADGRLVCVLCGAVVSMPKNEQSDQHSRIVYGYEHIRAFEFKSAMETFEGVIKDYPESVDGYWGYLQAYYGIVYVKGYGENLPKPTFCYAVEQEKIEINKHPHYQKILELVKDSKQKAIFEQRMKVLTADFQFVKRQVNLKEKYDVFICAKISPLPTTKTVLMDHDEKRTMDWQVATELYNQLTAPASGKEKPLKVFFSDRSIDGGIEYDKQIWSAMLRSRHILVVGTDNAHLESTWVKSEWRRWLYLIEKDKSRGKDTFIAYIPDRKNWPYIKPDVWDHYRVQITHTEDDMDKLIAKLRRNGSVVTDNSAPEFDMRDVEKIRALIAYGNYDSAHALLDPLFREHPEVGEFALLSMRLNTNNFTDMSSFSESQMEYAGKHLMLTAKAADNVDYLDAKKAMKVFLANQKKNKKAEDERRQLEAEQLVREQDRKRAETQRKNSGAQNRPDGNPYAPARRTHISENGEIILYPDENMDRNLVQCPNCNCIQSPEKTADGREVCTVCGTTYKYATVSPPPPPPSSATSPKNTVLTLVLACILGTMGIHSFYVGKIGKGVFLLLTRGFGGLGTAIDIFKILGGKYKDSNGRYLSTAELKKGGRALARLAAAIYLLMFFYFALMFIFIFIEFPSGSRFFEDFLYSLF